MSTPPIKTVPKRRDQHLRDVADCIRFPSMDAVQQAKRGHPATTGNYRPIGRRIAAARAEFIASGEEMATASTGGTVLDHLAAAIPELLGCSADLTLRGGL